MPSPTLGLGGHARPRQPEKGVYLSNVLFSLCQKETINNNISIRRYMARINRIRQNENRSTISVSLPQECIIALNNYAERVGSNRSLALEYIIRDWKRIMQAQKEARK